MSDDFPDPDGGHKKPDQEFGTEFEFDETGMEPGLELDLSGIASEPEPEPEPLPPPPVGAAPMPPPGQPAPQHPQPPPRRPPPPTAAGPSPILVRGLIGAAVLVVLAMLAASVLGGDEEEAPAGDPAPVVALEEGERAYHQGEWIEALKAFRTLRRFPTSEQAQSVRERKLEAHAIREIMEAEPSSTTVQRLEALRELYPDRMEVKDRLNEVRKALSSGARVKPDEPSEDETD